MMIKNLLPPEMQKKVRRMYRLRAISVFLVFTAATALLTGVLLLPSYVHVRVENEHKARELTLFETASRGEAPEKARTLRIDEKTSVLARFIRPPLATEMLGNVLDEKPLGISLASFSYERRAKKENTLRLSGTARRRDDLITFRDRLANVFPVVDLPVSYLAADRDVTFSLTVYTKTEGE